MPETPCLKQALEPLEQIQEHIASMELVINTEDEDVEETDVENENVAPVRAEEKIWLCLTKHLKGFRDPQVESD